MRLFLLLALLLAVPVFASEQPKPNCFVITKIKKTNDSKTRLSFIKRLLPVKEGDTICDLNEEIIQTWENALKCTNLFKRVQIIVVSVGKNKISLEVVLEEKFYWYPVPILDWANRNITEWIEKYQADPRLLIWGLSIYRENFRWNGELLKFMFALGSLKKLEFVYDAPWTFENVGFSFRIGTSVRNFAYLPANHNEYSNTEFVYSPNKPVEHRWYADLVFQRNIGSVHRFSLRAGWRFWKVNKTLVDPYVYIGKDDNVLSIPIFQLSYLYIGSDNMFLPTKGINLFASIVSYNFRPELTSLNLSVMNGITLFPRLTLLSLISGKHFIKEGKPFVLASLYGFGFFQTRGYEFVTIEGQGTATMKNELRYKLWRISIPFVLDPSGKFEIDFYVKPFIDLAYSYGRYIKHKLLHHWLPSTGISLELLIYQINAIEIGFAYTSLSPTPRIFVNMQWLFQW
ncbi:MAG: hypothetical protein GXO48_04600 [Chlorobi bacterium]|nr:hypothetical protein [Chlorobiota bacterium]